METYRAKGRNVPVRHRELALANSVLMAAPWSYWKEGVGDEWGIPGKVRLIKNRKGSAWARRREEIQNDGVLEHPHFRCDLGRVHQLFAGAHG